MRPVIRACRHLEQLLELAQLVRLRAQLRDGLHRVADDGDLVHAARLLAVQQLRQLGEAAIQSEKIYEFVI